MMHNILAIKLIVKAKEFWQLKVYAIMFVERSTLTHIEENLQYER